jgi:hypothetical protein
MTQPVSVTSSPSILTLGGCADAGVTEAQPKNNAVISVIVFITTSSDAGGARRTPEFLHREPRGGRDRIRVEGNSADAISISLSTCLDLCLRQSDLADRRPDVTLAITRWRG